jgi:hypothetical protein
MADTTHSSTIHIVPARGREGGIAFYKGAEDGNEIKSMLDKKESPNGKRGHQHLNSSSRRRASLAQSPYRGMILRVLSRQTGWTP